MAGDTVSHPDSRPMCKQRANDSGADRCHGPQRAPARLTAHEATRNPSVHAMHSSFHQTAQEEIKSML